jgi:hypothetical protein
VDWRSNSRHSTYSSGSHVSIPIVNTGTARCGYILRERFGVEELLEITRLREQGIQQTVLVFTLTTT